MNCPGGLGPSEPPKDPKNPKAPGVGGVDRPDDDDDDDDDGESPAGGVDTGGGGTYSAADATIPVLVAFGAAGLASLALRRRRN